MDIENLIEFTQALVSHMETHLIFEYVRKPELPLLADEETPPRARKPVTPARV